MRQNDVDVLKSRRKDKTHLRIRDVGTSASITYELVPGATRCTSRRTECRPSQTGHAERCVVYGERFKPCCLAGSKKASTDCSAAKAVAGSL